MDCDVGKEIGGCEKRSGSPVIADPASKKPRSDLVEESIVETGDLIAEIDKESIGKDDDDEFHCPMPNEEEEKYLVRRIDERLLFELGVKWIVYRLMVGKDETEKFISSLESLKNDYNEGQNSLIDLFEGPPKFAMVAVEVNTLEAKAKSGFGISEIVDRFYGVSDISQTSNQAKVTARLLFFDEEVLYLLNRKKIQRLAVAQHCTINIYTSGYPSCDQYKEDMIVDVVGERHDVCRTLVGMFLCVKEQCRYDKRAVHSMEMRMRNLPVSGLLHEAYVYGRSTPKMVASYGGGKEMLCPEHLYNNMPFVSVRFPVDYADVLTREEGKFINSIRGSPDAGLEVRLAECESGTMKLIIFEKSLSAARDAMKTFAVFSSHNYVWTNKMGQMECCFIIFEVVRLYILQKKVREVGDPRALELADVLLGNWWFHGAGFSYLCGMCCLTDDEQDEDDICTW